MPFFFFALYALLLFSRPSAKAAATPASGGLLVIANQRDHTILLVDPAAKSTLAKIQVGVNGHEVAVSLDHHWAYVPIYGNSGVGKPGTDGRTIDVVDLQSRQFAYTIVLGKPVRPHCAKFGPDGLLYVSAELANSILVVDTSARRVIAEIPTGAPQSHMFVISPDGRRIYTANVGAGSVSVLDVQNRKLLAVIPVAKRLQRISISNDGLHVFTHDQDSPRIANIDTATNTVASWIDVPDVIYASTPTPDGNWLLCASDRGRIHIVDLHSMKLANSFAVAAPPNEIAITPDSAVAYASSPGGGKINVLNVRSWEMEEPITMTPGVDGIVWIPGEK